MNFNGAEQAVRFAYNMGGREIMARLDLTKSGGKGELGPHDLHAEAAMVLAKVSRLKPEHQAAIKAYLAHGQEKAAAIAFLASFMQHQLREWVDGGQAEREAALRCALQKDKENRVRRLQGVLGVSFRRAREIRLAVVQAHALIYTQAIAALEEQFDNSGNFSAS